MLHGHIHAAAGYNRENQEKGLRRFDIGVDANDYAPVSLEEVLRMAKGCRKNADYSRMEYYLDAGMNLGKNKTRPIKNSTFPPEKPQKLPEKSA